jgi:hypothetical protein
MRLRALANYKQSPGATLWRMATKMATEAASTLAAGNLVLFGSRLTISYAGRQCLLHRRLLRPCPTKAARGSASAAGCAAMPPHTSDLRASSDSKSQRLSREGMQAMYKSAPSSLQAMTPSTVENQPLQDASPVVGKPTIAAEAGFSFADFACDVSPRR